MKELEMAPQFKRQVEFKEEEWKTNKQTRDLFTLIISQKKAEKKPGIFIPSSQEEYKYDWCGRPVWDQYKIS